MKSRNSACVEESTGYESGMAEVNARLHLALMEQRMEGRYPGLLEAAPDAIVVANTSGEIVLLNLQAEKQFGCRRDELLGQPVKNIIPEGFAERLVADDLCSAAEALAHNWHPTSLRSILP